MPDNGSELENLKRRLYSRSARPFSLKRHFIRGEDASPVEGDWQRENPHEEPMQKRKLPILKVSLIASVLFFLSALAIGAYFLLGGGNIVSPNRVVIGVEGPAIVDAGKPMSLVVTVTNTNPTPLQLADLLIEYPDGTKSAVDLNVDLPRERQSLGDIPAGASVTKNVQAVLFGQETEQKKITLTVEYRVEGSNAIFDKSKDTTLTIGSAPLSLSVDAVEELSSNQSLAFTVTVLSNSSSPIRGLLVRAEYPFGFAYKSADMDPIYNNAVWNIGDLPPGGKKVIHVEGTLAGEDNDQRVFKFSVGSKSPNDDHTISAVYTTVAHQVTLQKPFVGVDITLNGNSASTVVVPSGSAVRASLNWANNLPTAVSNLDIEAKLTGGALDPSSVSVPGGFYRSADNTLIWNKETSAEFASVESGSAGTLQFSFAPFPLSQGGASIKNPAISITVTVRANRLGENNVPEEITSVVQKKVSFASALTLENRAYYTNGAFSNTGPIPPKANKETTYTILWSLSNSSNAVSRATISATLPPYVRFVRAGSGADITYDSISGAVKWNAGTVPAGLGFTASPREASFQVALLPSVSQIGTTPILVNTPAVLGSDQFTGTDLVGKSGPATIDIVNDSAYKTGVGVVTK